MADDASSPIIAAASPVDTEQTRREEVQVSDINANVDTNGTDSAAESSADEVAKDAPTKNSDSKNVVDQQPKPDEDTKDKPTTSQADTSLQEDTMAEDESAAADVNINQPAQASASASKSKLASRRKSGGVPEHKKKLNKKASKAKLTHTDAKPGDYFYVRLKGYPLWPAIVCDESMLPHTLIKSRPVTAARPDGSYRADYEDDGAKVKDRTFPVMYLHTNEFGWIPNYDLLELDFETVGEVTPKMRKDLAAAHVLAAQQHDLDYYKGVLQTFMEAREADRQAKEAARLEKAEKAANKKLSKKPSKAGLTQADDDVEMPDVPAEDDTGNATPSTTKKAKRPRDDDAIPSDSSKKLKLNIKLNTPKTTNGAPTPKSKQEGATKSTKPKPKKPTSKVTATPEAAPVKEPELTAEERHAKKEKEILFLRHKLQKGLLTRDQVLNPDEMKQMSEFVSKLEGYAELEVSIIRATKINKVLKAILKLATIPREEEFHFKSRSQTLLDKWNKLLASEQDTPTAATSNGTSEVKADGDQEKASPTGTVNGAQEPVTVEKVESKMEGSEVSKAKGNTTEETPVKESSPSETKNAEPAIGHTPVSTESTTEQSLLESKA